MIFYCIVISAFCKIFADGNFLKRKIGSGSEAISVTSFPRDIHGAPPQSLIVKLAEVIGSFKNVKKMALFWRRVVAEVSGLYKNDYPTFYKCLY